MKVTKETMFKLVKNYSSPVEAMYREDYFAMAKSIEDCEFECDDEKAVLKFKGVEIYPEEYDGDKEQENNFETIATLYLNGCYDDYTKAVRYKLVVKEVNVDKLTFKPSKELLSELGFSL